MSTIILIKNIHEMKMKKTNCLHCNKAIETKRISRKYCSDLCRQYAYMGRKGFVFAHQECDNGIGNINILEDEATQLYQKINVNDNKKVIVSDAKNSIVNDNDIKRLIVNGSNNINLNIDSKFIVNDNIPIAIPPIKAKWIPYKRTFLNELQMKYSEEYTGVLFTENYFSDWSMDDWESVSACNSTLNYCLNKLLEFDRMTDSIMLDELIDLHEDIHYFQQSFYYGLLPDDYIYRDNFKELEDKLSQWIKYCQENNLQMISFKLLPTFKIEILCLLRQMKPPLNQDYYQLGNNIN